MSKLVEIKFIPQYIIGETSTLTLTNKSTILCKLSINSCMKKIKSTPENDDIY